jgi:hypothetical protein
MKVYAHACMSSLQALGCSLPYTLELAPDSGVVTVDTDLWPAQGVQPAGNFTVLPANEEQERVIVDVQVGCVSNGRLMPVRQLHHIYVLDYFQTVCAPNHLSRACYASAEPGTPLERHQCHLHGVGAHQGGEHPLVGPTLLLACVPPVPQSAQVCAQLC